MNNNEVSLKLSLNDVEEAAYSDLRKEYLVEDLEKLPLIEKDNIDIQKAYIYNNEEIEVGAFIRNGTERSIEYNILPVVIKNKNGELIGAKAFYTKDLGEIPPMSARPYKLVFSKENIFVEDVEYDECIVSFSKNIKDFKNLILELDEIPKNLSEDRLLDLFEKLEVEPGHLKMKPFELSRTEKDKLYLTLVINNGTDRTQRIPVVPITIKDAEGKTIISERFEVNIDNIKPFTSKLYTLAFDKHIDFNDYDMSNFEIDFIVE